MADDPLRPRTTHPRIPPPPGGFAAAVAGARVKRRRRAASAVGAAASASVALLVAVSVVATGADPSSLRSVDPVTGTSGSATPNPVPPAATPSALRPSTTSRSVPVPAGPGAPAAETTGSPAARPSARPAPNETATPMKRTVVPFAPSSECDNSYVDSTGRWCEIYSGAVRARVGTPVTLSVDLCRIGTAGTATFESTREADMHVYSRDGRATTQWRWSTGRRFVRQRLVIPIENATCLRFSTTWSTRTSSGKPIAPGVYTIRSEVVASISGTSGAGVRVFPERTLVIES